MIYLTSANSFRDPIWAQWIQPALATFVDPASSGPLSGSSQRWSLARFNPLLDSTRARVVNYASAGPSVDPATAVPLIDAYITVRVWIIFFAGPFFESFHDLGLKKCGPCPESRVGPLSESDNTLCEWGNIWDWKKVVRIPGWSALWGGPIPGLHCTQKPQNA